MERRREEKKSRRRVWVDCNCIVSIIINIIIHGG